MQNAVKVPQELNPHPGSTVADDNLVNAFGTLTLGSRGESTFFGKTARAEYFISALAPAHLGTHGANKLKRTQEPPFEGTREEVWQKIFGMLPMLHEAMDLCEVYQKHGKYM